MTAPMCALDYAAMVACYAMVASLFAPLVWGVVWPVFAALAAGGLVLVWAHFSVEVIP